MRSTVLIVVMILVGCTNLPPVEVAVPPTPQARAVVFDIDGTLTPDVLAILEVRPDAAKAVGMYSRKGYSVIYLSTRASLFQTGIPEWLKKNGFPAGSIHVAQTHADRQHPDTYKSRIMKDYQSKGWKLVGGYGDSSTDFDAYADVGIPRAWVFALLRRGKSSCEPGVWEACLNGWAEHLSFIEGRE